MASNIGRVAVIGGGIGGLASAFYLQKIGADVTLYEAADRFGGLGRSFQYDGREIDCFYHVMLPSDEELLGLCRELGLVDRIYWRPASLGCVYGGRLFSLARPPDVLAFGALPILDRLRLGWTAIHVSHIARPEGLDAITAADWLRKIAGRVAFDRLLEPLLMAKFGDAYDRIPALWYWSSFTREKGTRREVKGYLHGGYSAIADALVASLRAGGARLRSGASVRRLAVDGAQRPIVTIDGDTQTFDRVVVTLPLVTLRAMCDESLAPAVNAVDPGIDYQGVVNVLLVLNRSVTEHYWVPVIECDAPFHGFVETTRVIDLDHTGGHHLVYLMKYTHRRTDLFERPLDDIAEEWVASFLRLFPDLSPESILDRFAFRAPFVEPIYTPGYLTRRPPAEIVDGRVYLATTAQAYPGVTSWNRSTELARAAVDALCAGVRGDVS